MAAIPQALHSADKADPRLQTALQETSPGSSLRVILVLRAASPASAEPDLLHLNVLGPDALPPSNRREWRAARAQALHEAQERAYGATVRRLAAAGLRVENTSPSRVLVVTGFPANVRAVLDDDAILTAALDREVAFDLGTPR